jgi:2-C-methyl-D-erythritol 4-phosphate cytidylyltransferase
LEEFQKHPSIDKIIIVTLPAWIEVIKAYAKEFRITKLNWIVEGGSTGQESICNGLQTLKNEGLSEDVVVMIHDGNRCNISSELISDSLSVYAEFGSAVAAIPCVEAVFKSQDGGKSSTKSIPREELYRTQTHDMARQKGITNTAASCSLMEALGETVYFSGGLETNLKITTQEDLLIFKALRGAKNK